MIYDEIKKDIKEKLNYDIQIIDRNGSFNFKCNQCGNCCKDKIPFTFYDIYKLAIHFKISIKDFLIKYSGEIDISESVPLIYIKKNENGYCIFADDKKCMIHDNKPTTCLLYPLGRVATKGKTEYILVDVDCLKDMKTDEKVDVIEIDIKLKQSNIGNLMLLDHNKKTKEIVDFESIKEKRKVHEYISMMFRVLTELDLSKKYTETLEENLKRHLHNVRVFAVTNPECMCEDFNLSDEEHIEMLERIMEKIELDRIPKEIEGMYRNTKDLLTKYKKQKEMKDEFKEIIKHLGLKKKK